ncbi:MAG TPA: tetratricopeptide repeat protein [Phycisphaerales bacterium]|nr:tetratricopeptide repeat protein [Phycisphaerales bacterium]
MIRSRLAAAVLAAVLAAAACALVSGCGASGSGRGASFPSPVEQLGQARQAALVADATARKAERAESRGREDEAGDLREQAIAEYREALTVSGEMPDAWNNLGVLLMQQEDLVGAADAFTMAMQLSPTDPRPAENLGLVYARAGWAEESLKYYDLALERSPDRLQALRGALKAAHLLGQADERRLDQVRRALLMESEEAWRDFFAREQVRISGRLESDRRAVEPP